MTTGDARAAAQGAAPCSIGDRVRRRGRPGQRGTVLPHRLPDRAWSPPALPCSLRVRWDSGPSRWVAPADLERLVEGDVPGLAGAGGAGGAGTKVPPEEP